MCPSTPHFGNLSCRKIGLLFVHPWGLWGDGQHGEQLQMFLQLLSHAELVRFA